MKAKVSNFRRFINEQMQYQNSNAQLDYQENNKQKAFLN